jgi:hypothetical protein
MGVLEKYIAELEIDVKLDELNLKDAALCLPARKAKWVSRLITEKRNLYALMQKKSNLITEAVNEIKKESPVNLTYPTLEKAAEKHPIIVKINIEIEEIKNVIEFLEKVEKTISSISFDIKNLVEIIKMETT